MARDGDDQLFKLARFLRFTSKVKVTDELTAHMRKVIRRVETDRSLFRIVYDATANGTAAGLHVVPDPVYGEAVTNARVLPPTPGPHGVPLAVYCGDEFELVVNPCGTPGRLECTYDFLAGTTEFEGESYQLDLRAPARPLSEAHLAGKFNHCCPVSNDRERRLEVKCVRSQCPPDCSIKYTFALPVLYAPPTGLPRPNMVLEYNYGPGFWDTLKQLRAKGVPPGYKVMWCVCRHRENKPCPLKRGRLVPPPAGASAGSS